MNQEKIEKAIESIEIAFSLIEFAYRIQLLNNEEMAILFRKEFQVKDVIVEKRKLNNIEINHFIINLINGLICPFWIAIDEAFEKIFGKKKPENNSYLDDFRAIIYMFRCAFAHEISEPKWYVRNTAYKKRSYCLKIPKECQKGDITEFSFNFEALNGLNVKKENYKHFRGLFTFYLVALHLLKEAQTKVLLGVVC